jgi:sodium transport system permease protein
MRDRRTVITSLVLPVILYPLLMIGFSSMMSRQELKLEKQEMVIYVNDNVQNVSSICIEDELKKVENFQIMEKVGFFEKSTFLDLLEENSIQALIDIQDSTSTSGFLVLNVSVYYNRSNEKSSLAHEKIVKIIKDIEQQFVGERLSKININVEILNAVEIKDENIAPPEKMMGFALGKFLPYLLIILTISGASVIASDLVAGEKERGTLETILVSAARRNELVIGKYLTIITMSIVTVLLNLFSMYITFSHIFSQADKALDGLQLPLGNFALILLIMLPLITLFSAILLSISTYSRNIKEAQSYQMPLIFGSIMLSMVSFLPGFELNLGFALIPIVNFSLLIRDIMLSSYNPVYLFIVVGSTLVLDIIMVSFSIRLFNNETVLFRTAEEKSLKFWGKGKKDIFSVQFIVIFFFIILLALYFIGGRWQSKDLMNGLVRTELLIILLPVILLLRVSKSDIKKSLGLNPVKPLNFFLVILAALPLITLAAILGQLINLIYPVSESYMEAMKNLVTVQERGIWFSIFVIGILPGICEETMFRGYMLNAFRKKGFWPAIVITALLFGIFHLDLFRLLPVTMLGIWMGFLALKANSLYLAIFAHALNNSLAIVFLNYGDKIPFLEQLISEENIPFWYAIPTVLILYAVFMALRKVNEEVVVET